MRKQGITTRLADDYVQDLLSNTDEWFEINDYPNTKENNSKLLTRVKLRLLNEHNGISIHEKNGRLKVCKL